MQCLFVDDEAMNTQRIERICRIRGQRGFRGVRRDAGGKVVQGKRLRHYFDGRDDAHDDGFSAVKEIHKSKDIPVIMLSARGEEYDKLFGFEMGADDYVTKPFSPKEVMARIAAVTKRHKAGAAGQKREIEKFEGLEIDMKGRNVYVDGQKLELTPKEYELLFYLVKNKGIALSREKLLSDVWGFDFYGDDRTVDTHIKMLRSNLKEYRKFIVTLRGLGYKFEA